MIGAASHVECGVKKVAERGTGILPVGIAGILPALLLQDGMVY